ncbi:MAG: N-formylglutamate amidohydrolase [Rhizobiaceae bacterium]|nr:MAG: N-formylglutamate amidohydrolase [Rhizobiaceae bacterium]
MILSDDFAGHPPFVIRGEARQSVPFVFNSPHSGNYYPQRFLAMSRLDRRAIRRSEDCFVDELFAGAVGCGAVMMAAHFPRAYLDVNREPWELDPRMFQEALPPFANIRSPRVAGGLGAVPRIVGEGQEIYSGRLPLSEAIGRIDSVYKPYHAELRRLLVSTRESFGHAVLIDCHSMPGSVRAGEGTARADFIVGDRFGASCVPALTQCAIGLLTRMGYRVAHNRPYAGGFITEHYGRPAQGLNALQVEVSRSLYMDERSYERTSGFFALAKDLSRFCTALVRLGEELFPLPLAAE